MSIQDKTNKLGKLLVQQVDQMRFFPEKYEQLILACEQGFSLAYWKAPESNDQNLVLLSENQEQT